MTEHPKADHDQTPGWDGHPPPQPPPGVTLTPPPRVGRPRADRGRHRGGRWLAALWLGILGLGTVAVFALLPGWVESRSASQAETSAATEDIPRATSVDPTVVREKPAATPDEPEAPPDAPPENPPRTTPSQSTARPASSTPAPSPTPDAALPGNPPPQATIGPAGPTPSRSASPPESSASPLAPLLNDGLAALTHKNWTVARESFQAVLGEASETSPEAAAARDGLRRVAAGEHRTAVTELRGEAEALEVAGRWADALARWEALLALDPTLTAAREGRQRSRERARLAEGLGYHLDHPERLAAGEVRREAETLARRALDLADSDLEPPAPGLAADARRLLHRVAAWGEPVPATLLSDAETRVTVHRVGRLGSFRSKVLSLTPGSYTVVGRREGFRDVRRELVIRPGAEPEPLYVACEEEV